MTTAVAPATPRLPTPAVGSARDLLNQPATVARFEKVLQSPVKAAQFVASLATLVYGSKQLKAADPNSIIAAAVKAAALDLAIDPSLGHAYIVPYGTMAQFQIGWKGLVQLALRTGEYALLNVAHVVEGEVAGVNKFTGEIKFGAATSDKVVGVIAYLKLRNGYEKYVYWTTERIHDHAKKYSKSYSRSDSAWQTNAGAMELKTVMRDLLTKWGMLSIEMRTALAIDAQAGEIVENVAPFEPDAHVPLEVEAAQTEAPAAATGQPDNAALDAEIVAREKAQADLLAKRKAAKDALYPPE